MEYARYVWDATVWFVFFLVSEVYTAKWKDVKEVLWDVFLFAIVLVIVSNAFVFIGTILGGGGGLYESATFSSSGRS